MWIGVTAGVVVVGAVFSNYYISKNQSVYVINDLEKPITVSGPGISPATIPAFGLENIRMSEGQYKVAVTGATNQFIDVSLRIPYWQRWTGRHSSVLMIPGTGVILEETAHYSPNHEVSTINQTSKTDDLRLYYGQPFLIVSNVDFFFEPFPDQIQGDTRVSHRALRRIDYLRMPPNQLIYFLLGKDHFAQALDFAEWYLREHPNDVDLLTVYVGSAKLADQQSRARTFLKEGAHRLPTNIEWHRMYQETSHAHTEKIIAEYDHLLSENPTSSVWLYLRGRLSKTYSDAVSYYEKAIEFDPENAYAHFAYGVALSSQKQWAKAKSELMVATHLRSANSQFQDALFDVRMALGEFESLSTDLENALKTNPLNFADNVRLADVYASQGLDVELRNLVYRFAEAVHAKYQKSGLGLVINLNARVAYSIGNFAEIENLAQSLGDGFPPYTLFQALVEESKFEEAFAIFPLQESKINDPLHYLAVSSALVHAGREKEATDWLDRSVALLEVSRPEYQEVGQLLRQNQPPPISTITELVLTPVAKAQICIAFGLKYAAIRDSMFKEAMDFNISRDYPYHLIRRIVTTSHLPETTPPSPLN